MGFLLFVALIIGNSMGADVGHPAKNAIFLFPGIWLAILFNLMTKYIWIFFFVDVPLFFGLGVIGVRFFKRKTK